MCASASSSSLVVARRCRSSVPRSSVSLRLFYRSLLPPPSLPRRAHPWPTPLHTARYQLASTARPLPPSSHLSASFPSFAVRRASPSVVVRSSSPTLSRLPPRPPSRRIHFLSVLPPTKVPSSSPLSPCLLSISPPRRTLLPSLPPSPTFPSLSLASLRSRSSRDSPRTPLPRPPDLVSLSLSLSLS